MSEQIKYAKFIPPEIEFKGNIEKMEILSKVILGYTFAHSPFYFMGYYVFRMDKSVVFYNSTTYTQVFKEDFTNDELFVVKKLDDDTLLMNDNENAKIVRFYENEPKKITYEIIQEIKDTEYYYLGEILSNGLLLLGGLDKKYRFYRLEHHEADKKVNKNNLYKKIGELSNVHNVYDDDVPHIIDLNSGYLFSMMNDDKNIKLIQYEGDFKIIKSWDGYTLHDAGLISDKYIVLKGLTYPEYFTWLLDLEKLEIVKTWKTPNNDSFVQVIAKNKFLTGTDNRFALQEIKEENGDFVLNDLMTTGFQGFERFYGNIFLDEKTFITLAEDKYSAEHDYKSPTYIVVFKCE